MMKKSAIRLAMLLAFLGAASGQIQTGPVNNYGVGPFTCNQITVVPPTVRAEGMTELLGDIVLTCTGGIMPPNGSLLPTVNITISLGTNVTSRLLGTGGVPNASEALLLIDEPGSVPASSTALFVPSEGGNAVQTACGNPTVGANPGGCPQYARIVPCTGPACGGPSGIPVMSSSPVVATPPVNVYQGWVTGNQVTFQGIPVMPPASTGIARVFRITNIRANSPGILGTSQIIASISISGGFSVPVYNPVLTVAYIQPGLTTAVKNATNSAPPLTAELTKSQCTDAGNGATAPQPLATLQFSKNFGTAFKTRVMPVAAYGGQSPVPVQNIPGTIYTSESGFVAPYISANGNTAGLADFGTRLRAVFNNIPAGVRLFVSTTNLAGNGAASQSTLAAPAGNSTAAFAQLVNGETTSDSNVVPLVAPTVTVNGGATQLAELPVVNGNAVAVWEVINTNPAALETLNFGVWEYFTADSADNLPSPGTGTVYLEFAPGLGLAIGNDVFSSASATLPVPRFAYTGTPASIISIAACSPRTTFTVTTPPSTAAGSPFNLTVTANMSRYSGTLHFTSSDPNAVLPPNVALTNGSGTFSATLRTVGLQTITATDAFNASISGFSSTITVSPAAATHFVLSAPNSATSGTPFNFTVTALDQFNNVATGYTGVVHFAIGSSQAALPVSGQAVFPPNSTLTNGRGTFSATFWTGGPQAIAAADVANPSIAGLSNGITIGFRTDESFQCAANVAIPYTLRAEGMSESLGDIVITCNGGTALPTGSTIPTADITITLGTNITSRLLGAGTPSNPANTSEALLLIDEPGAIPVASSIFLAPNEGGNAPQTLCTNSAVGAGQGGCTQYVQTVPCAGYGCIYGVSNPLIVMSSSPGAVTPPANLYQGLVSGNQVTFKGVPILPPAGGSAGLLVGPGPMATARVFRITNLRANVAGGGFELAAPGYSAYLAAISINGAPVPIVNSGYGYWGPFPYLNFPGTVLAAGFVESGLNPAVRNPANTAVASPSDVTKTQCGAPGNNATPQPQAVLQFQKAFGTAFKVRVQSGQSPAAIPGVIYNSESGFISPATGSAGLADYGTRLKAVFRNVPPGVRLFVSTTNLAGNGATSQPTLTGPPSTSNPPFAALVNSETAPDTDTPPLVSATTSVNNGATLLAEIPLVNGSGTAVWEVMSTNVAALEALNFGVWESYSTTPPAGVGTVNLSYAPTPPAISATSGPIPRFADTSTPATILAISGCGPTFIVTGMPAAESTTANTPFPAPLQVMIRDSSGNPVSGVQVMFVAAPNSGIVLMPGQSAVTNAQGIASVTAIAGATTGTFPVVATAFVQSPPPLASFSLTVQPAPTPSGPTVQPGSLMLVYVPGAPIPPLPPLAVSAAGSLRFSVTSSGPWVSALPTAGRTPATVLASADPTGLVPGFYNATLTFTFSDGTTIPVPITLQVQSPPR